MLDAVVGGVVTRVAATAAVLVPAVVACAVALGVAGAVGSDVTCVVMFNPKVDTPK